MPAPLMPPPTTSTSQRLRRRHAAGRRSGRGARKVGARRSSDESQRNVVFVFVWFLFCSAFVVSPSDSRASGNRHGGSAADSLRSDIRIVRMTPNPRQALLLDEVRARGSVSVEALAERFGVTLQTVRRDVKLLADAGLLARFHGGVRVPSSTTENIAYRQRQQLNEQAKQRIARAVAAAVPTGCSLIINIGTTTEAIARELLHHRGLRVITNNLNVAAILSRQPRLRGDRRRRPRALARPRHRRRGHGRLHPPVQGRHRPDRHLAASRPTARCATSTTAR